MIKDFYHKYKLIILGFIIFTLYFWSRFLRSRTSKFLPLNLNIVGFLILLNICCIFIYIIISLIRSSSNKNPIIEQIIDWLFIPIMAFDNYFKSFSVINNSYQKFLSYIIPKLDYYIIQTNIFYIIFWMFPRLILLSALFIDVFIYKQLHYKYMVVLFGLLLFFNRYFKYSLKNTKESILKDLIFSIKEISTNYYPGVHPLELEPDYNPNKEEDEDDYDENDHMILPLDIFIKFYTESKVYRGVANEYNIHSTVAWNNIIFGEFDNNYNGCSDNINSDGIRFLVKKQETLLKPKIEYLLNISLILEFYNFNTNSNKEIKNIKILIYLNYLLCWLYILVISIHTLNTEELIYVLNSTWLSVEDPFIQDFIYDSLYNYLYIHE